MFPENERPVVEPKTSLLYIIEKEDDSFNNPNLHVFGGGCSKLLNFRGDGSELGCRKNLQKSHGGSWHRLRGHLLCFFPGLTVFHERHNEDM